MTTFEKIWQYGINYKTDSTNTTTMQKNGVWWFKAFLKGDLPRRNLSKTLSGDGVAHVEVATTTQDLLTQGLWTCYYSCDGSTAGTPGDGIDRWGDGTGAPGTTTLNMGGNAGTTNSGSAASFTTGATIAGAVRMTGVANMTTNDVGNFMTITGAATSANNSPTNTPFKIVQFNSSTSVDIYNPLGATTDANNGSIAWTERNPYTPTANTWTSIVTSGGAHSWFVLKSPIAIGPYYIILDYNTGSASQLNIWMSKAAPTGGTTSARPTATDEMQILNSSIVSQFTQNTTTGNYMHGILSTDGYFNCFISRGNGAGYVESAWIWQILGDTKAPDNYKAYSFYNWGNGGEAITIGSLQTTNRQVARNFNGSAIMSGTMAVFYSNGNNYALLDLGLIDFNDGQYDDLPIYIFNNASGQYTLKGRLVDIRQCPGALPSGFTEPSPSNPVSTCIGSTVWVPCNLPFIL